MKVLYGEGVANHAGPESCARAGDRQSEALTGVRAGRVWRREKETPVMHGRGKSDSPIAPEKSPNKVEEPTAEAVEGRGLAKGNRFEQNAPRTQRRSRVGAASALERIGEAARKDRKQRFTALLHQVCDPERLRTAFKELKHDAAPG